MARVLVVDDQRQARDLLCAELAEAGFLVRAAADGEEAWESFCASRPDVVVTDMAMPRCDGLELLRRIRSRSDVPVIIFTGHGSIESAASAFKAGADDFVNSLELEIEDLVSLVKDAARGDHVPPRLEDLEQRIVGDSEAASRVRWQVTGLAPLRTPVLVSGETGTGRSTVIRALHELGATSTGELRRIDAAAFEPPGPPVRVPGPTAIHLRDVEHLSATAQEWWAEQLAPAEPPQTFARPRVLASTSTPLSPRVRDGSFHSGLGRSLLRFHIELPPLRERREDVPAIARALLARIGTSVGRARLKLSPAAQKYLTEARLPENVAQLERLLERAAAYSVGRVVRRQTLQDLMVDLENSVAGMRHERNLLERDRLLRTLQQTGGNITHTAEILEKSRAAVYRLIEKHNIPLTRGG